MLLNLIRGKKNSIEKKTHECHKTGKIYLYSSKKYPIPVYVCVSMYVQNM